MRRALAVLSLVAVTVVVAAGPALACGGLLGPTGGVNLLRTATLAAYHGGVEHYVTAFEFAGKAKDFGSIIPLPGIPSRIIKGGDWTLQRLALETQPPIAESADAALAGATGQRSAKVIAEKRIDALDVTILEGGGDAVGLWAEQHGFNLPPDAPEVLDFYAKRSPIFMAAKFDAAAAVARGQIAGDGTPVHLVIPTPNPWVPLRILGLGKSSSEVIEADVYLLTDIKPALLPRPSPAGTAGTSLEFSRPASELLLQDLRSDRGMKWLPEDDMWLSYLKVDTAARFLEHDLAIDASGQGAPSAVAAGLADPALPIPAPDARLWAWAVAFGLAAGVVALTNRFVATR